MPQKEVAAQVRQRQATIVMAVALSGKKTLLSGNAAI
jgi:hypothetical protein